MHPAASHKFSIQLVRPYGSQLSEVIDLWKAERRWLGFFPLGAFEDYARRGGILASIDPTGKVSGYIAIRVASEWFHIAHLCVAPHLRRSAVASHLVGHVSMLAERADLRGIRLKCRNDFPASHFWPKAGFRAMGTSAGRGKSAAPLTHWVMPNQSFSDLFTRVKGPPEIEKSVAILDANVFFDLSHENDDPESLAVHVQESIFLTTDLFEDAIELAIVDEMFTEIHRRKDIEEAKRQHLRAAGFPDIPYDNTAANRFVKTLEKILGWEKTTKDQRRSDMRQIAKAAASKAEYFITRDEALLAAAGPILNAMPIRVVTPAKLLSLLDEDVRGHLYNPAKIQGTAIRESSPRLEYLEQYPDRFLGRSPQEPGHSFRTLTRRLVALSATSTHYRMKLVQDENESPILLRSVDSSSPKGISIPLLRATSHLLAPTVTRHFILQEIQSAAKTSKHTISIHDPHLSDETLVALLELGFSESESVWTRRLFPSVLSIYDTTNWPEWMPTPDSLDPDHKFINNLETTYWPVKITGTNLPCASITIKPHWAGKLFGGVCAEEELFPVDPAKVFNRENVYYRSFKNWPSIPPKRLLWYVSAKKQYHAASTLLKAEIGTASELFRRYERLGVYEWKDILRQANGNPQGKLMALHFAETEIFDRPVELAEARESGIGNIVVGVHPISEDSFLQVYTAGLSRFHST